MAEVHGERAAPRTPRPRITVNPMPNPRRLSDEASPGETGSASYNMGPRKLYTSPVFRLPGRVLLGRAGFKTIRRVVKHARTRRTLYMLSHATEVIIHAKSAN